MALTDILIPYELLIRYGDDGKPTGAHIQYRRRVVLDDEVIKDDVLHAQPLTLENFDTSDVMSDTLASALDQINVLQSRISELEAEEG